MSDHILMKLGAIKGETQIKGFVDQIELQSFSHNIAMPMTGDVSNTKRTSGTPHVGEISISKLLDLASVTIYQKCLMATDVGEVVITLLQKDNDAIIPMLTYTLKNVLISSYSIGAGGGVPSENLSLNFTHISVAYVAQKGTGTPGGNVPATWDLTLHAAS